MKKLLLSVLALLLCLALVGCGNNATEDAGEEDVLHLVAIQQMNNDAGQKANFLIPKYVEYINANGGVNGRKLVVDVIDSGDDQQAYINAYQKAVNTEGVDGIIGHYQGPWDIAAADIANEAKIATINLCCNRTNLELCEYYFITRAVTPGVTDAWAQLCIDKGITHPVFLGQNIDNTITAVNQFVDYYASKGLTFTLDDVIYFDYASTDWNPIVLAALEKIANGCDGIVISGTVDDDGQQINKLLYEKGNTKPVCLCEAQMDDKLAGYIGGEKLEGDFGLCSYALAVDTQENKDYIKMVTDWGFIDKFGAISWSDTVLWDSINIFCKAAETAGDTTKEAVFAGLTDTSWSLNGAMSSFSAHADHCFNDHVYVAEFVNGAVTLTGETVDVIHTPIEW